MIAYLRVGGDQIAESLVHLRRFGQKSEDHPSVGTACPACGVPFAAGDYTTLVPLGPGASPREQERARWGGPYNAVAVEVHWACATGRTEPMPSEEVAP